MGRRVPLGAHADGSFAVGGRAELAAALRRAYDSEVRYFVVREQKDYGPYSVESLIKMIRSGRVRSVETLRSELTEDECMVVDVPALRPACEERRNLEDKQRDAKPSDEKAPAPAGRPTPPARRGRPLWVTTIVVAGVVAAAGVAGEDHPVAGGDVWFDDRPRCLGL